MSFLTDYHTATSGDEAPENYHLWCAIGALAAIVGRRVWVNWGRYRVYPNLYIVLLGPPGNGKTSAMGVAKRLIRDLQNVPFSAEAQTKESLCKEMPEYEASFQVDGKAVTHTPIAIFVTELSHFLGPASGHMIDFLTTVYDQDVYDTKTKGKGNDYIVGPCVNLLACTTPAWITTYLKSDIISGGFTRRSIFVNETEEKKRIPFPVLSPEQEVAKAALVGHARRIEKITGEIVFSPVAKEWMTQWYLNHERPDNEKTKWYYRTKHVLLLKVAIHVCVAEGDTKVLETRHLRIAMDFLEKAEANLGNVFFGMGRNELFAISERIVEIVNMHKGAMPEKKLRALFFQDAHFGELEQIIQHLTTTDRLTRLTIKAPGDEIARGYLCLPKVAEELKAKIEQAKAKALVVDDATAVPPTSWPTGGTDSGSSGASSPPSTPS